MSEGRRDDIDIQENMSELRIAASETQDMVSKLALLELSANLHGSIEYCELMAALLRQIDSELKIESPIEPLKFQEPYISPVDVVDKPDASDEDYTDAYVWIKDLWSGVHEIMDFELFKWVVCGYRARRIHLEDRNLRKFFIACASLMTIDMQAQPRPKTSVWAQDMAEKAITQVNLMLKDNILKTEKIDMTTTLRDRCKEISSRREHRFLELGTQLTKRVDNVLQKARSTQPDAGVPINHRALRRDERLKSAIASYTSEIRELAIDAVRCPEEIMSVDYWCQDIGMFFNALALRFWEDEDEDEEETRRPVRLFAIQPADPTPWNSNGMPPCPKDS